MLSNSPNSPENVVVVQFSADESVVLTEGTRALIRYDNKRGITVFPPSMTGDTFREYANGELREQHTFLETVNAVATAPKIVPPT